MWQKSNNILDVHGVSALKVSDGGMGLL